jgi:adenylate cyclase
MIMAFWGAPISYGAHAQPAVLAALDMINAVEALKPQFAEQGLPEINIGIGLNTGIMSVGDMGSEYRRAYTVIGDSVNLASRLEGLTKYYGVEIVISEFTYQQLEGIVCRKLDRVQVKGKTASVEVYEPLCTIDRLTDALQAELDRHHEALEHYWARRWDEAQRMFEELCEGRSGSTLYQLYLSRIDEMRQRDPGPDWNGVYERRSK